MSPTPQTQYPLRALCGRRFALVRLRGPLRGLFIPPSPKTLDVDGFYGLVCDRGVALARPHSTQHHWCVVIGRYVCPPSQPKSLCAASGPGLVLTVGKVLCCSAVPYLVLVRASALGNFHPASPKL